MHSLVVVLNDCSGVSHVGSLVGVLSSKATVLVCMLLFVHMLVLGHVSILIIILCSIGIDFATIALVLPVRLLLDAANNSHLDI